MALISSAAYPGSLAHRGEPGFISAEFPPPPRLWAYPQRRGHVCLVWVRRRRSHPVRSRAGQLVIGHRGCRHGLADALSHDPHRFISADFQDPLQRQHGSATALSPHRDDHPDPFCGASWSYEKSCRPSARSGNHKLCRHINDASDGSKLGRADSEDTDNPEANATQKDVSDKLFGSKPFLKRQKTQVFLLHNIFPI